jgi:hypothetical protein
MQTLYLEAEECSLTLCSPFQTHWDRGWFSEVLDSPISTVSLGTAHAAALGSGEGGGVGYLFLSQAGPEPKWLYSFGISGVALPLLHV